MAWDDETNPVSADEIAQSLGYADAAEMLAAIGAGGGAEDLDDLTDVAITTPASGQVLRYNGSAFVNAVIAAADLPTAIDAVKIGGGAVSNTEFGYLDGVTSAIQTQLNAKLSALHSAALARTTNLSVAASTNTDLTWPTQEKITAGFTHTANQAAVTCAGAKTVLAVVLVAYEPGGGSYGTYNLAWFQNSTEILPRSPNFTYGSTSSQIYGVGLHFLLIDLADTDTIKVQVRPDSNGGTVKSARLILMGW